MAVFDHFFHILACFLANEFWSLLNFIMRIKEIQSLIKFVAKSGASEVSLEMKDVKITIKTSNDKAPVVISTPNIQSPPPADISVVPQPQVAPQLSEPAPISPSAAAEEDSNLLLLSPQLLAPFIESLHLINLFLLKLEILFQKVQCYV